MGSSSSKPSETDYIEQIKSVDENELDLNKIDTLQMKAIKQLVKKIEEMEKRKSDRIMYKLPAVNLCSYSLIWKDPDKKLPLWRVIFYEVIE